MLQIPPTPIKQALCYTTPSHPPSPNTPNSKGYSPTSQNIPPKKDHGRIHIWIHTYDIHVYKIHSCTHTCPILNTLLHKCTINANRKGGGTDW